MTTMGEVPLNFPLREPTLAALTTPSCSPVFRKLRILVLLVILVNAALGTWLARARTTSWETPLRVMIYPINADASQSSARHISGLSRDTFAPAETYFDSEAERYGISRKDLADIHLGNEVKALPPAPPQDGNVLQVMFWSLSLRLWAWRHAQHPGQPDPHVRIFVLFYDPARTARVAHSLGLEKGLVGVVHAFSSPHQTAQNNVVLAHELLHTVGATDKYAAGTNQPVFPEGYAEPEKVPLHPQEFAELMAGRTALSETESQMPSSLNQTVIGSRTAREIGWIQ
jgi:hypothetical protein